MIVSSILLSVVLVSAGGEPRRRGRPPGRSADRATALRALCEHLGIGLGDTVADVGAGRGNDSWTFAAIVGAEGIVYAEEIDDGKVKRLKAEAERRKLAQVRAVLGVHEDPRLPKKAVDLIYMRRVYHHLSKPRSMVRAFWRALKPGGLLVIVDERRGTLRDWVPRELRAKRHFLLAETTVVREAREEGFAYVECAEKFWNEKRPFVLVFKRPPGLSEPKGDPDPFLPLDPASTTAFLLPLDRPYAKPLFIALGEGRKLIAPLVKATAGTAHEIVLEEWATQKDERPPLPEGITVPSTLTDLGDPQLGPEPVDAVFFLDTFHLLFHGKTLLAKLKEALGAPGVVYILDREAPEPLSRREGSHRRAIAPATVIEEMEAAGFHLWARGPTPAADRFLLCFGTLPPGEVWREIDPLVAGPRLRQDPQRWLAANLWRLRGVRTADGRRYSFGAGAGSPSILAGEAPKGQRAYLLPAAKRALRFVQEEDGYRLTDVAEIPAGLGKGDGSAGE